LTNTRLYQFGLSNSNSIQLLAGGSNSYLSSRHGNRAAQIIRGDDILLNEPKISMIKIDIEGFEPHAIEGLSGTLAKHKPIVLCEFNPRCLTDHAAIAPSAFAETLFILAKDIIAIEHDGQRNSLSRSSDLMSLWENKNHQAVTSGILPNGMLHFDLLFKPR
jgi:hypothetical protein